LNVFENKHVKTLVLWTSKCFGMFIFKNNANCGSQEIQVNLPRCYWSQNFQILDFACFASKTSKVTDSLNETVILPVFEAKLAKSKVWKLFFHWYFGLKPKMKNSQGILASWKSIKTQFLIVKHDKSLGICKNKWFVMFDNQKMYFDGSRMILDQICLLHWRSTLLNQYLIKMP
jgi:hypothetical protein